MIITCKKDAPQFEVDKIVHSFENQGLQVNIIHDANYNVFGIVGDTHVVDEKRLMSNPWVENVTRVAAPYKKVNRFFHPEDSVIDVGGIKVGGREKIVVIGGPCSVEGVD
ncbi:MAG: 3-deoxy-7-phosphoheptulonate synthase, partial [Oscillospiraceae bacterium]|nr:3-deoxy-7-phosphoheptulonate synthase [Oscillospiraceae bacterium]